MAAYALPDEVEIIAEVLHTAGYRTGGIVTNFNLATYFNFHQGFDFYKFLEPRRFLWADDNARLQQMKPASGCTLRRALMAQCGALTIFI